MNTETNNQSGQKVPDTATTYERAKPEKESPSKSLGSEAKQPPKPESKPDQNAQPISGKTVR